MRIFYALTFSEHDKERVGLYKDIVANHALKGRFTQQSNFHLTLVFIGEVATKDLDIYESVLDELKIMPTTLHCRHIGAFHKKNRDIVWLGIEKNAYISELQKQINASLNHQGIVTEKRKYHPHITLGRQVLLDMAIQDFVIPPMDLKPYSVALMVSHRVHGQLIYEPIYEIPLTQVNQ